MKIVSVSVNSTGQYQVAVVPFDNIYISCDFGNTWVAKIIDSYKGWLSVSINSSGQYISAATNSEQIYVSYCGTNSNEITDLKVKISNLVSFINTRLNTNYQF